MIDTPGSAAPDGTDDRPPRARRKGVVVAACALVVVVAAVVVAVKVGDRSAGRGDGPLNQPADEAGGWAKITCPAVPGRGAWLKGTVGLQNDDSGPIQIESVGTFGESAGFETLSGALAVEGSSFACFPRESFDVEPIAPKDFGPLEPYTQSGQEVTLMVELRRRESYDMAEMLGFEVTYVVDGRRYTEQYPSPLVVCADMDDPECQALSDTQPGRLRDLGF